VLGGDGAPLCYLISYVLNKSPFPFLTFTKNRLTIRKHYFAGGNGEKGRHRIKSVIFRFSCLLQESLIKRTIDENHKQIPAVLFQWRETR
jgi:hypothetical protein